VHGGFGGSVLFLWLLMAKRVLRDYPGLCLCEQDLPKPLDFAAIFGRRAAVRIEIGCGGGTVLLHEARASADCDFVGIEWARRYYRQAVDRMGRWGMANVRIIRTDAASFTREYIPEESVSSFDIYFPDPWPKTRHHRRRFFCDVNVREMLRCLVPQGRIQFATDHADYFQHGLRVVQGCGAVAEPAGFVTPAGAAEGELVGSNYERKYAREHRAIYVLAVRKCNFRPHLERPILSSAVLQSVR